MAKQIRCERCFAPKKDKDDECEFCGLNPKKEREMEEMLRELEQNLLEQEKKNQEKWIDLPFDERIRKYSGMGTSRPMMGMFGKMSS